VGERRPLEAALAFGLIVSGTVLSMAGTDLVLPAVPSLPDALGGTPAMAQMVLAAFVAGTGLGLLLFGALAARVDSRGLLVASLGAYGLASLAASLASTLPVLVGLRFVQGAAGSAPAVFAPGMIRLLFDETRAVRAMGWLGSIESLVPALAPIAGVGLLTRFGWQASFWITGLLSVVLASALAGLARRLPRVAAAPRAGGYAVLLRDPTFLRYALSQAFSLGGLLVFVFGAPVVIIETMGGTLADFIVLQVTGIVFFILGANVSGWPVARFGAPRTIFTGTLVSALGLVSILVYAMLGGNHALALLGPWIVVNLGFGVRGPPGFMRAVVAARGDDARGAALVVLAILMTGAAGTAVAAPFITAGLSALAAVAAAISLGAVLLMVGLPGAIQPS
jgi:MFS family permease